MIDIHNHVLFAVDDGSESLEESIEMLREYKRNGVGNCCFTPHLNHPNVQKRMWKRIKEKL